MVDSGTANPRALVAKWARYILNKTLSEDLKVISAAPSPTANARNSRMEGRKESTTGLHKVDTLGPESAASATVIPSDIVDVVAVEYCGRLTDRAIIDLRLLPRN
ncbi:unnamed protein product [Cyclocybe aegerita]|uniref:Uncharacterized protein n=1 Tax=Cyclocybe aegerita TaxID=1973307 RepID=A0A8S0WR68_CYCAE|nr:unnamed protein product [Cyclocybe aegerita]